MAGLVKAIAGEQKRAFPLRGRGTIGDGG